jgi:RloB-like protein
MKRREGLPRRRDRPAPYAVLVYCGGVLTEPDYFKGLRDGLRRRDVTVKVRQDSLDPRNLVRVAAAYRDRRPGVYNEVWWVVDVDQFDMTIAAGEAERQKINLAVSNPCFELWLLLHHADCRSHCAGYPDVARRLKKHVPAYDKARLRFADYAGTVGDATKRARDLDPTGAEHHRNPSTSVWRLAENIMERQETV